MYIPIPNTNIATKHIETIFQDTFMLLYALFNSIHGYQTQVVSKILPTLCPFLGLEKLTHAAYSRQAIGQNLEI